MTHPDYLLMRTLQDYHHARRCLANLERHPSRDPRRPHGVIYWDLATSARDLRELAMHLIDQEGATQ